MNDIAKLVEHSPLGVELENGEIRILVNLMQEQRLSDGDFLIEDGSSDDSLHVILDGKV